MNYFYTDHKGDVTGPVTREQLQQFVEAGVLPETTQVCCEGSEQWQPISAFVRATPKPQERPAASKPAAAKAAVAPTPSSPPATPINSSSSSGGWLIRCLSIRLCRYLAILGFGFLYLKLTSIEKLLDKKATPPQFEYKIESPEDYLFDIEMNSLGKDGWEIVSARRASSRDESSTTKASYEVILKRQIR